MEGREEAGWGRKVGEEKREEEEGRKPSGRMKAGRGWKWGAGPVS